MRAVLLLAAALALSSVALPVAAACDEWNPCDPPPMPLCPTSPDVSGPKPAGGVREWLACWL